MAVRTMQSWLLALMLLLHQQQLPAGQQLVRPPDEGPSTVSALLSNNLNATALGPGVTIKTVERQATAPATVAAEVAEMLQVTPANQLPLNTSVSAAAATSALTAGPQVVETASAVTLDAVEEHLASSITTKAAGVLEKPATQQQQQQPMRIPPTTAAQIAKINVASAVGDQIGTAPVIPDKINIVRTVPIMPAKTKRTQAAIKSVVREGASTGAVAVAGIKLNTEPEQSQDYVNATEAWPALTTTNMVMEMEQQGSTIYPPITGTSSVIRPVGGKTVPTPRLLGGGASVAHILAKSLENPQPPSATGWPVKHAAVLEGDVILGGLMMVHSREDSITCGPIMPQGGIQALEAMLYTLDQVNKQQLLPNVTLGAHLLDDCDKDTYGLEMAVDFIKASAPEPHESKVTFVYQKPPIHSISY